ncbi:uncharacterized protein RCC_12223 [Ramularia collo-cygni]|uniref:Uncharacterized protein n=1 Tax=Ramularia collo-cygni TaxID=112498 RepID=A0A2D3V4N0_9PEZI|nr:uncharacterized protein RCC_12223 [Ramularia collo-cygni]CZT15243.1 uncharacterized protein RCC_12223 [Ramularia collo-cygni]
MIRSQLVPSPGVHIPSSAESNKATNQHVEPSPKTSVWSGFRTPPASAHKDAGTAFQLLRNADKQPALSFGFSTSKFNPSVGAQASSYTSSSSAFGASSFGAKPLFGSSCFGSPSFGSASFGQSNPILGLPSPSPGPQNRRAQPPALPGDDVLSRAVRRATVNRPAIIGNSEIGADNLMASYLSSHGESSDVETLTKDLVSISQTHPTTMSFLRHIFEEASRGNGSVPIPPKRSHQSKMQISAQSALDFDLYLDFRQYGWSEDLRDYIVRMIVYGLSPREIRAAVKADMDFTHGQNHVSAEEVEELVLWMRGREASIVEDAKLVGSTFDFFRPSILEERRLAKAVRAPKGSEPSGGGRAEADANAIDSGTSCRCGDKSGVFQPFGDFQTDTNGEVHGIKQSAEDADTKSRYGQFRFMDLPAELRDWVYKLSIIPTGFISLRSCAHHMPAGVFPAIATSIFGVSKAVNKEAEGLLLDNTIIVNGCLEWGSRSAIHRAQLPEHIIPLIKSLVIVIDFTRVVRTARVADWRVAQGMIGLKRLRICGIAIDPANCPSSELSTYLGIILERVPADCEVCFGEENGGAEVEAHVQDMVEKIKAGQSIMQTRVLVKSAGAIEVAMLESAWKDIEDEVVKGCKSGFKEDFRFADRRANGGAGRPLAATPPPPD